MAPGTSIRFVLLAAWAVLAVAVPVRAQSPSAAPLPKVGSQVVAHQRLMLDGRETHDPEIERVLETVVGTPLSPVAVRESIVHLMATGRFEDVRVSTETTAGGLTLTYNLIPLRSVKDFAFRGDLGVGTRQLRAVLRERFSGTPPASRIEEMAGVLESFYHGRGFLQAKVQPRVEPTPDGKRVTLVFNVAAGPRARIASVTVEGAPDGDAAAVQRRLGLQRGSPFDREGLERRITEYTNALQARGYHAARIEPELGYSEKLDAVTVTIRMRVGSRVSISFTGDQLPATSREEVERLRREGLTDEDSLEDAQQRIEDGLRAQGYRDARVTFAREERAPGQEQVVFTVRRGSQYHVAAITVVGNEQVPLSDLREDPLLLEGQYFVKSRLDVDVARMTEHYKTLGFRMAEVVPSVASRPGQAALLDVSIKISEGPKTTIADVVFEGHTLPVAVLQGKLASVPGTPYFEPNIATDRDRVLLEYLNRGYSQASVEVQPTFSADGRQATLRFRIREGVQVFVDHILIVGNVRTSAALIQREINLRPGMPISIAELAEAQRRLIALGLFRRVEVRAQRGTETRRDVLVVVEEAPPTSIGYGGGFEVLSRVRRDANGQAVTRYEFTPRGFFEIGRRNLWGKNRSVNLFTRAAIRASDQVNGTSTGTTTDTASIPPLEDTSSGFREYRVLGTFREPRIFGSGVDLSVTALADQAIRSTFDFRRRQTLVEGSHRFGQTVSVAGRYTLGRSRIFNSRIAEEDKLNIDRLFSQVRLSSFSTTVTRDTRDDLLDPSRGLLLLFDGTVAARRIGSEVGLVKGVGQGFAFKRLPALGGSVLALGVRVGLATGLPRFVPDLDDQGNPKLNPDGSVVLIKVQDIPASERFFAGGDNTLRAFETDRLGAPDALDRAGVSNGGNALLLLNGELRFPILSKFGLGGVVFVDVGNVFLRVNDIDLGQLRSGVGGGIRWKSPLGPLRVDFGWKTTRRTFANGDRETPFAISFGIGQAF